MTTYIYKWLENALDIGINEQDFWNMTIAEFDRAIESYARRKKLEAQERASFDYILADLIGRSVARIHSSSANIPDIAAAYPSLFDSEEMQEQKQAKAAEISAIRFRQFANFHNNNTDK